MFKYFLKSGKLASYYTEIDARGHFFTMDNFKDKGAPIRVGRMTIDEPYIISKGEKLVDNRSRRIW